MPLVEQRHETPRSVLAAKGDEFQRLRHEFMALGRKFPALPVMPQ
ncbi:hypothetical protein ABT001_30350 [Streptomyces sp. NPDC002793]